MIAISNKEKHYKWDKLFNFFESNEAGITHTHTHDGIDYFMYHTLPKIKNREFKNVKNIKTSILELHELSSSLVSMSLSIQEYQKAQEELLDSIIKVLVDAIDSKSAYTGGHRRRVPEIAQMLTKVAHDKEYGIFKEMRRVLQNYMPLKTDLLKSLSL